MTRTNQAFEIAQNAIASGIWNEKTAYVFVTTAHEMTDEQFQIWVDMARGED